MGARRTINRYKEMNPICDTYEEALKKGKRLHAYGMRGQWGKQDVYHDPFYITRWENKSGKVTWMVNGYSDYERKHKRLREGTVIVTWNVEKKRWVEETITA